MGLKEKEWPVEERPKTHSGNHVWLPPDALYIELYVDDYKPRDTPEKALGTFNQHMNSMGDLNAAGPSDLAVRDNESAICWLADGLRGYHGVEGLTFCKIYARMMLRTLMWAASRDGHFYARDVLSKDD